MSHVVSRVVSRVVSYVVCGVSPELWLSACSALFAEPYHDSCLETDVAQTTKVAFGLLF